MEGKELREVMAPEVWGPPVLGQESGQGAPGAWEDPPPECFLAPSGHRGLTQCSLWLGVMPVPLSALVILSSQETWPHQELLRPGAAHCRPCLCRGVGGVII